MMLSQNWHRNSFMGDPGIVAQRNSRKGVIVPRRRRLLCPPTGEVSRAASHLTRKPERRVILNWSPCLPIPSGEQTLWENRNRCYAPIVMNEAAEAPTVKRAPGTAAR